MSDQLSAHRFKSIYEGLGIDLSKLGCVMLGMESLGIESWLGQDGQTTYLTGFPLYHAKDKDRFWIDGYVGEKPHITLLYGLLEKAHNWSNYIQYLLEGWELNSVEIEDIGYFDSPYEDEPYYCIVAHIKKTPELIEGHRRLEFLPHINTFTGYKPHVTVAYIKKNEEVREEFIKDLKKDLVGKKLEVTNINLGDR